MHHLFVILWPHSLPHTPSSHVLLMPNSKHLTHGISNLVSLITKTKLGLSTPTCTISTNINFLNRPLNQLVFTTGRSLGPLLSLAQRAPALDSYAEQRGDVLTKTESRQAPTDQGGNPSDGWKLNGALPRLSLNGGQSRVVA
jgi:hypothetical protein